MANPMPAFPYTKCDVCGDRMEEGDSVYFHDGAKYCSPCACEEKIVCDCGKFKKLEFDTCFECKDK